MVEVALNTITLAPSNKSGCHNIVEKLMKVTINTID
jgi:hypothetical protein